MSFHTCGDLFFRKKVFVDSCTKLDELTALHHFQQYFTHIRMEDSDYEKLCAVKHRLSYFFSYMTDFFPFQNNPKNLDPSCKMDLDFWDCLGRTKLVL